MASVFLPDQNAFFLHLPKTAGYSISTALESVPNARPYPVRGMKVTAGAARQIRARLGADIFSRSFSFAFVRNPWDWAVSGWKHVTINTKAYDETRPDFQTFMTGGWRQGLVHNPNPKKFRSKEMFVRYHCFVPQWDHLRLYPWGGLAPLAFTAQFERLEEDWARICRRLGLTLDLPHRNQSAGKPYQDYYTRALVDLVARQNRPLIDRFGYRFDRHHP